MIRTVKKQTVKLTVAKVFEPLFKGAKRRNFIFGGRGSGKSYTVAEYVVMRAFQKKTKVLCCRELQKSIADSVLALLAEVIEKLGLSDFFEVQKNAIYGKNGSQFIFAGIKSNVAEIKSMQGIDIAWCEESQALSRESYQVLVPTVRAEGSIIIFTFNPFSEKDICWIESQNPDENTLCIRANYDSNPWLPDVLKLEIERDKSDPVKFDWVWNGNPVGLSDAQVFLGKYEVKDFETPNNVEFHWGADWGFACVDGNALINTNKGLIKLRDIRIGDYVLTRKGYKKVLYTKNKGFKKVLDLDFGYENHVIVTADHKVFTLDGWKEVQDLKENETICVMKLTLMGVFIKTIRTVSTRIISTVMNALTGKTKKEYYTETFMSSTKDQSQKDMSFIIKTIIRLIMILKTWLVSLYQNITKLIFTNIKKVSELCLKRSGKSVGKRLHTIQKIGCHDTLKDLKLQDRKDSSVKNVESQWSLRMFIKNTVVLNAENMQTQGKVKASTFVKCAVKSLWRQLTTKEAPVLMNVRINSVPLNEEREVFDISIDGEHEFFANGLLVHNCDPTTLIRSFVIGNTLYIDKAVGKVGCDLEDTPALFNQIEGSSIYPIYADSARPETISFMRKRKFNVIACEKWNGSVEDGIQFLRSFSKIIIHPRCKEVVEEFDLYQYKVDKQTGEVLREPLDKFNHYIDALRYSYTMFMRGQNNGKVYEMFDAENICKDESVAGQEVYLGTLALPGRILWVSATVSQGRIKVIDAFAQGVIDFKAVKEKYPRSECVWMPLEKLADIQQNYVSDCVEADIEPACGSVLPAEGEGTKLVNDLFERHSLSVMEGAWTLISCLNERVFLAEGKVERSSKEQENTRYCRLFEYLIWRIICRLQVEEDYNE